jgi:hypothetical protein
MGTHITIWKPSATLLHDDGWLMSHQRRKIATMAATM